MDVLIPISQQLSNSTTSAYSPAEFTVSPSIAVVNVLFFLSLALVLIDAFLAMLVKSWLQEFDHSWRKYSVADLRAQERERRLQGLERWKLAELVALLPILIQTALLFFCIGLIVLLFPIHLISAIFSSVALVVGLAFYMFTTGLSIFDAYSPFSSPVSRGLTILVNELRTIWLNLVHVIAHHVWTRIPGIWFLTPHPSLPRDPSIESVPGNNNVTHSLFPQGTTSVEKSKIITQSHSQIDPQTYVDILERLVTTTAEAVENLHVFLDLLDQPVKDPTLRPSNVEKWKELLHTTLGLLGEPSTFSDSVARTITRSVIFCYGDGRPANQQLSRGLMRHFDHLCSSQTGRHKPLNHFFAPYLNYCCQLNSFNTPHISNIIATLEPSNAADAELLWMVNTIHNNLQYHYKPESDVLDILAAVVTYVSTTEQSKRSQVPLTAAIIYAMHTIKSAIKEGGIRSIPGPYVLPGTILTNSESMTFHQVDTLDLWSKDCVELASALLQLPTHLYGSADKVWKIQLGLIAALYIDSNKQMGQPPTVFAHLLRLTNIPEIKMTTWGWADTYDQTRLAGYWYMAAFQEPIYQPYSENSPVQDIGYIIMQIIQHHSEIRLSALHLLDFSVKYLCGRSSSLTMGLDGDFRLEWADTNGLVTNFAFRPFNPWIPLHLDTLFFPSSILSQRDLELEKLEWTGTPELVHIAMDRLALYDSLVGNEYRGAKKFMPEPALLDLFLKSKDYEVCTGAFKCCLNLASQPSSAGDTQSAGMFIPGTLGCQWIEHLMQVLCEAPWDNPVRSWEFLAEHLTPKWAMLPHSWCCDFASAFLFFNVHYFDDELPLYQWFTNTFIIKGNSNQDFLPFLGTMLELIKHSVTSDQLASLETWLAQLPKILENPNAHIELGNVLASREQEIVNETLRIFAELPMADPEWFNDVQ